MLYACEVENGFATEELLPGVHPKLEQDLDFARVYLPLLTQLVNAQAPNPVPLQAYLRQLRESITDPASLFHRLEPDKQRHLKDFMAAVIERLSAKKTTLPLVLSHGDLFSKNVVVHDGVTRAIDWMRSDYRSPLFDLYFLHLHHYFKWIAADPLESRLTRAIDALAATVDENLAPFLSQDSRWRWLFYLECTYMKLVTCDRDPSICVETYLRDLKRYEAFEAYLRSVGKDALPLSPD